MYRFFETIRLEDEKLHNLEFHQHRVAYTFKNFFPGYSTHNIESISSAQTFPKGLHKCRISYNHDSFEVRIEAYNRKYPTSLMLVEDDNIEYNYKYEFRQNINSLYELRINCDDILIIRNGRVTDSSFGNICFEKDGNWYTPDQPLLQGTQRAFLLHNKRIVETGIQRADIPNYDHFTIINAMLPFQEKYVYPVSRIFD